MPETIDIDTGSHEALKKTLATLAARVTEQRERGEALDLNLKQVREDLHSARQALAEERARASEAKDTETDREIADRYIVGRSWQPAGLADIGREHGVALRGVVAPETGEWVPGLLDDVARNPWQRELQTAVTELNLVSPIMRRAGKRPVKTIARIGAILERAPAALQRADGFKAFAKAFVDSAGVGAEWIIDLGLPMLAQDPRLTGDVAGLFDVHTMQTQTELLPFLSTSMRAYKYGAPTGDDPAQFTSSSLTSAQLTVTANGFVARAQVDPDAEEDAILRAVRTVISSELVRTLREAEEDCLINGDSTATHGDTGIANWNIRSRWGASGLGGTSDHRRTYIGLRHRAIDDSKNVAITETTAGLIGLRATMGSPFGGMVSDLVYITSLETYLAVFLDLAEVLTVDKYGPSATVLTGELARLGGVPIVISDFVDKQYNTSGIYDNNTKTKSGVLLVNRSVVKITQRAGNMVEVDKDITRGIVNMVARNRRGLLYQTSAGTPSVWAYNASVS